MMTIITIRSDEFIKWYEDYKQRKVEETEIKENLLRVGWYPSRWRD